MNPFIDNTFVIQNMYFYKKNHIFIQVHQYLYPEIFHLLLHTEESEILEENTNRKTMTLKMLKKLTFIQYREHFCCYIIVTYNIDYIIIYKYYNII